MHARVIAAVIACLSLAAPASAQDAKKAELGSKAKGILMKFCFECHCPGGSGTGNVANYEQLKSKKMVKAGDAANSSIYIHMEKGLDTDPTKWGMPPREVSDKSKRPTADDLATIKLWINEGCPAPAESAKADKREVKTITAVDMIAAMEKHLRSTAPEERRFIRYFTIVNLYNDARVDDAKLNLYRAAIGVMANNLSWQPRIVQPTPIDPAKTIFAFDLRDYGWDADGKKIDVWQKMLEQYPYGLTYEGQGVVAGAEQFLKDETDCPLPYVRADWFATNAMRPPLYHFFLNIPIELYKLEERLGVNVAKNFARNRLARAGITKKSVSDQHRLIERHDSLYGAYWKSYDFGPDNKRGSLLRYPLGPPQFDGSALKNKYAAAEGFVQDGGEMVFNLPNGLQGYMLVDGKDRRIDTGPDNVVGDPNKFSGTRTVVNGVSCMGCHNQGIKEATDVVRDETLLRNQPLSYRKVELLFPTPIRMTGLMDDDRDRFLRSMVKAVDGYFDSDEVLKSGWKDPVTALALRHYNHLDLMTAAAELGTNANFANGPIAKKSLTSLGLGGLAAEGGTVSRADWEYGIETPMQKLAQMLELGSTLLLRRKN